MKKVIVEPNQSLRDIALQHYGTMEAVGEIFTLNCAVLVNDPRALIELGVDVVNDKAFYMDAALEVGLTLAIDDSSGLINKNTVRQLTTNQTKYTL